MLLRKLRGASDVNSKAGGKGILEEDEGSQFNDLLLDEQILGEDS